MARSKRAALVPVEHISRSILILRGRKVLLDEHLAVLYGVTTSALVQAVKHNILRFPKHFLFQLTAVEWAVLRSQSVISTPARDGRRYSPYAFTEQGFAMLSSALASEQAIVVNIQIMRAFVRMRELFSSNATLARKLDELEHRYQHHDDAIKAILSAIRELMTPPTRKPRLIGFTADLNEKR